MTIPPFAIESVPVPKLPILSPPPAAEAVLFQVEPGPVTVTAPVEPAANPMEPPLPLFTVPPFSMVSMPMPKAPTWMVPVLVHVEPGPDTVAVPREPGESPTKPAASVTVPPFWTVSVPTPLSPTTRFSVLACPPASMLSVPELRAVGPRVMLLPSTVPPLTASVPEPTPVGPTVMLLASTVPPLTASVPESTLTGPPPDKAADGCAKSPTANVPPLTVVPPV
jgi:hypothetical protein